MCRAFNGLTLVFGFIKWQTNRYNRGSNLTECCNAQGPRGPKGEIGFPGIQGPPGLKVWV